MQQLKADMGLKPHMIRILQPWGEQCREHARDGAAGITAAVPAGLSAFFDAASTSPFKGMADTALVGAFVNADVSTQPICFRVRHHSSSPSSAAAHYP